MLFRMALRWIGISCLAGTVIGYSISIRRPSVHLFDIRTGRISIIVHLTAGALDVIAAAGKGNLSADYRGTSCYESWSQFFKDWSEYSIPRYDVSGSRHRLHYVSIPLWLFFVIGIPLVWVARNPPRSNKNCECGYDLTGNESGVCPECGVRRKVAPNSNTKSARP